jgi:hypothetical protein
MGWDRRTRFLSAACYFGLAPWLWFAGAARQRSLLSHHLLHSLIFLLLAVCWVLFVFVLTYMSMLADRFGVTMGATSLRLWENLVYVLDGVHTLLMIILPVAWILSMMDSIRGRVRHLPLITKMAANYRLANTSAYLAVVCEILFVYLSYAGIRAVHLIKSPPEKADVYVLYTVGGYIPMETFYETFTPPKWAIAVAFYPMLDAGSEKWGEQSVKVLPLSEGSFKEAIRNGRVIFVASHGGNVSGSFTISYKPYRAFKPSDIAAGEANPNLQYVYFAGCDTGDLESDWRRVLSPAEVKSFDRISYVDEHMFWVWFKSPAVIAALR